MFAHDRVLELMVDMIGVKSAPTDYFTANAAYAKPKLTKLAKGSTVAAMKAKAALGLL